MKQYLRILLVLLGLYLAACVAIGVTVAEIALHPHHRALTDAEQVYAHAWATDDGATLTNVEIKAADGIPLRAWEVDPDDSNGSVVLLLAWARWQPTRDDQLCGHAAGTRIWRSDARCSRARFQRRRACHLRVVGA